MALKAAVIEFSLAFN